MDQLMTLSKFRTSGLNLKVLAQNSEHQESVVDDPLSENDKEEQEDPLSNYRSAIDESCLQHQNGIFNPAREATLNAIVNIAPGQNQ